jgi:hypothetical protein
MRLRVLIILFIIQITIGFTISRFQSSSGFMDADYYYSGGIQIVQGNAAYEPFIWNYLDNPTGLPHPSFTYWMPLASLVASIGMILFHNTGYFYARSSFLILAGFIPVLSAWLAWKLTKNEKIAWFSGFTAIFSGFYIVYFSITETVVLYMLVGASIVALLLSKVNATKPSTPHIFRWLLIGLLTGLMHLTRADGLVWFAFVLIYSIWWCIRTKNMFRLERFFAPLLIIVGYFLVMSIWMIRNIQIFTSLFPPGGLQTIWLTEYDQLFSYPASIINFTSWASAGIVNILRNIGNAVFLNLQSSIAVQGTIILFPLMAIGVIYSWKNKVVPFVLSLWLLTFIVMSFVFPFSGARGGFLHSSSAFQPVFWAFAGVGLQRFIDWGQKKRHWVSKTALRFFSTGIILICAILTGYVIIQNVIGSSFVDLKWDEEHIKFEKVESVLRLNGATTGDIVMVKNPPGYYVVNNRSAIVIPFGSLDTVYKAGIRYDAKYLLLDQDHTMQLDSFYNNKVSTLQFRFLTQVGTYEIYEILDAVD